MSLNFFAIVCHKSWIIIILAYYCQLYYQFYSSENVLLYLIKNEACEKLDTDRKLMVYLMFLVSCKGNGSDFCVKFARQIRFHLATKPNLTINL